MSWQRPPTSLVRKAIDTYLRVAYQDKPPSPVRLKLESLRRIGDEDFYQNQIFETDNADSPAKYKLRLGNQSYPHMKLVIERAPSGGGFLFRADSHDQHCRPSPESREYPVFCALMNENRKTAEAIESAWEQEGLPTFKKFLRDDLARRASSPAAQ